MTQTARLPIGRAAGDSLHECADCGQARRVSWACASRLPLGTGGSKLNWDWPGFTPRRGPGGQVAAVGAGGQSPVRADE
jgi:hypothetical protein